MRNENEKNDNKTNQDKSTQKTNQPGAQGGHTLNENDRKKGGEHSHGGKSENVNRK